MTAVKFTVSAARDALVASVAAAKAADLRSKIAIAAAVAGAATGAAFSATKSTVESADIPSRVAAAVAAANIPDKARRGAEWVAENPKQTALLAGAGLVTLVPAIISGPALGILGFGAQGVIKGSVAAGMQSGIGNVIAPSIFAMLQSAGTGGYGVATVNTVVSASPLVAGAMGAGISRLRARARGN
ncbi:hypothetical protein GGS23DRAFT_102398 [Durotheca rogersii]|uniref:uncharacterized protein n=1 Tax=Durotheca rogersii TaxID=419775 RepID=UPI00221EA879|nr:uncharacterized protein GGS23DRAFT_102398 [Durotheca rogersii]KAI5862469.1 hypothetical protein GGS23DRAFT_102398 [Durotheca rogersii]